VAATVLGLALIAAAGTAAYGAVQADGRANGGPEVALSELPMPFEALAPGIVSQAVAVTENPSGGREVARLVTGTDVQIGGVAKSRNWLLTRREYWVRWQVGVDDYYGFVPVDSVRLLSGSVPELSATAADSAAGFALIDIPWLPSTVTEWSPMLRRAGAEHGVDPELLAIIVLVESGGNPHAGSSVGARGLMQVMPATGQLIASERGIDSFAPDELYDPETCIDFGAYYLAQQLRSFGRRDDPDWLESVRIAAAAYNGGPGNAQRGTWPQETQAYVRWVTGMWRERKQANSDTYHQWLAAGGHRLVASAQQQLAMR
jgi:hypothetical protein